jgi:Spy/CpxP family protein refolding chaperone
MLIRTLTVAAVMLTMSLSAAAQIVPQPGPTVSIRPFFPEDVLQRVRDALNLTEAQVSAVRALITMRAETMQQIGQETGAAYRRLQELMAQSNPNPTEVGNAFLATRTAQEKMQGATEKFKTDFQAMLSAEQRATLSNLTASAGHIEALRMLGVIDYGFGPVHIAAPSPMMPMPVPFSGAGGGFRVEHAPIQ